MTFFPMYIDGAPVPALSGKRSASYQPATRAHLADLALGGPEDVDRAVRAARRAADEGPWTRMPGPQRAKILRRIAERLDDESEHLAELEARDSGGTIRKGRNVDVPGAQAAFEWAAWWAERVAATEPPDPPAVGAHLRWDPIGVVAAILPWNLPLLLAAWRIAPAIAAGNACVVKPASFTSLSTVELARIMHECDLPPGIMNVVLGPGASVGSELVRRPDVDMAAFTGSDEVGEQVILSAARTGKRLDLGLGGKSPSIVLDDADLDRAVAGTMWGIFFHNGQICMAASRSLVHESIYPRFVELLAERARGLRMGDPLDELTDLGPLVSRQHARSVQNRVRQAVDEGARLVCGGERPDQADLGEGLDRAAYFPPTVLADVDPADAIARDEVFGPVLAVISVRSDEHAVAVANASAYRLSGAVWSGDRDRARRVAERLRMDRVWVNDYRMVDIGRPDWSAGSACWDRLTNELDTYRARRQVHIASDGDRARYALLNPDL